MRCQTCGRDNPDDARFCGGCGTRLAAEVVCDHCGTANAADASFCIQCGARVAGEIRRYARPSCFCGCPRLPRNRPSFANGRYTVKRFLGEGGKKKVYLAHDTLLDRDVAFALIKTEGLDDGGRERVTREAQAMGRLGAHPHIVTVFDIGEEDGQPYLVCRCWPAATSRA